MTNWQVINAVCEVLDDQFKGLEMYTVAVQDSANSHDPTVMLTVVDRSHSQVLKFRAGQRAGWMWDDDHVLALSPDNAVRVALAMVKGERATTPRKTGLPDERTDYFV
ncbi:hypothetical protein [Lacticaseibacillus camelliae]|uniref:Uncharacterized protein n=1 Tax=Lacticaseibacillus camelliae DSM 22697 = JCM 13995 TaxID=1423730 RepID=A0A0R2EZM1_9LACO|nr:hypothetical protein [Lacticaseibacillus camelliae]KRN21078.1 hypothetical protein FC75_GL000008 [Lacticaseibacillus camelliae DSM 22697 = JCM 13995]